MKQQQPLSRRTRRTLLEALETLEARRLFTFSVASPISDVAVTSATSSTVSLAGHFHDPSSTSTTVRLHVNSLGVPGATGDIDVQLTDAVTPQTVANFLAYVNAGLFNNTIIHRSVPGFIIQGGGFYANPSLSAVSTFSPVVNEFTQAQAAAGGAGNPVNVRGTIAMAKVGAQYDEDNNLIAGTGPDSATSGWFFNLANNSSNLDNQNGGFTTFGTVSVSGMNIVDAIAGINRYDLFPGNPNDPFGTLPLAGDHSSVVDNLVTITYATADCTYQISTTNPSLFSSVSIVGSQLTLNYAPGKAGSSDVIVTATDFSGHTATDTFAVTVTQPVISVTTGGTAVTDNQATPVSIGNPTQGATASKTFRVTNTGNDVLTLSGYTVPAGFVISSPSNLAGTSLNPGEFVDVVVTSIATNTGGAKTGTLILDTDDPDTAAFDIPLTYTVLTRQVSVANGATTLANTQSVNLGTSSAASFTTTLVVKNTGTGTLTFSVASLPTGYSIDLGYSSTLAAGASANLVLRVDTTTTGTKAGNVVINTDDPNVASFTVPVTADVQHAVASAEIVNSDTTTSALPNPVDFGAVDQNSTTPNTRTVRITNTGTQTLNLTGVTEPAGFFISSAIYNGVTSFRNFAHSPSTPPSLHSLAPGEHIDIIITQRTDTGGDKAGTLLVATNDPNATAFPITLAGFTHYRKLEVSYNSTNLVTSGSPHVTPNVDLGSGVEGATYRVTFRVTNTGDTLNLSVPAPTLPAGYSLITSFATPLLLAPGESADIVIAIDTTSPGARNGTIVFNSSDPVYALPANAPGFRVPVTAVVNYRRLAVTYSGTTVPSGASYNFGTILQGDAAQVTLRLANTGNLPLTLSNPVVPAGFTLVGGFPTTLAAGALADVVLALDPLGHGTYSGAFSFTTDDPTRTNFSVNLAGRVMAKGIVVSMDGNTIAYGEATTINFGRVRQGTAGQQVVLTISNSGLTPLSFQPSSLPAGFSLVQSLPDTLAPGASAQLVVSLDTTSPGIYGGLLHIVSSDPDRPSFDIPVSAGVTLPVKLGAGGAPSVTFTDIDGTVSTITLTGPGSATLDFLGNNLVANVVAKKGTTVAGSSVSLAGVVLAGTSAGKSTLTITSKGGNKSFDLGDVSGSPLLALNASAAKLVGNVNLTTKTLTVASASGATLKLGAGATVTIPTVTNTTLTTAGNIKSLTVTNWTGGAISAQAIDNLAVNGNINASLTVKKPLAKATIKGNVTGGTWTLAGITKLAVNGSVMAGWVGNVSGNVAGFTVAKNFSGSLTAKVLSLAVNGSVTNATLTSKTTVTSLAVKGNYVNTNLTAKAITKATLGTIKTHNGGAPFTIKALSIASLSAKLDTGKSLVLSGVNSTAKLTPQLAKAGNLNDLKIQIA